MMQTSTPAALPRPLRLDEFEMTSEPPGDRLLGVVSRITGYREATSGHFRQQEAASLVIPLIISFGTPFAIGLARAPTHDDRFGSFAAGLFAGPVVIDSFGASHCLQVDFTPLGARRFFKLPMHELADCMIPLDDVLGADGDALREQLGNLDEWPRRFDLVRRFIEKRIDAAPALSREIESAFQGIEKSGGKMPIERLANRIGWSRKHLANRFRMELGLGPKAISRVVRFNRAQAQARIGTANWADIAADCGYADQAHLTREFQVLSGRAPTRPTAQ